MLSSSISGMTLNHFQRIDSHPEFFQGPGLGIRFVQTKKTTK